MENVREYVKECVKKLTALGIVIPGSGDEMADRILQMPDNRNVDVETGSGMKTVTFQLNKKEYKYEAKAHNDWFDIRIILYLNQILQENHADKLFYFTYDGWQNCIVFYNTEQWAQKFHDNFAGMEVVGVCEELLF